ncbi:MAG: sensor histidine kinase, partial [Bryobacteraceae bacterium]|nr:sensor histidine kinase [Bryobacteraceae bacterium]
LAVYVVNISVFILATAPFPRHTPRQRWLLLAQIFTSIPLESNLSVLAAITIPLVLRKGQWWRWLAWTLGLLAVRIVVGGLYWFNVNRSRIPSDTSAWALPFTLSVGLSEILAWHMFGFLAAMLIVRIYDDQQRLALLNAELKGAQFLLMDSGRLSERVRISRELHDSLGHHLTSLSLQLEIAERLPDSQIRPKLREVRFLARLLMAEIREAVSQWRSETSPALTDALRSLSGAMPGITVEMSIEPAMPPTPPSLGHALFRCAQEALTNAVRHGGATTLQVSLRHQDDVLYMEMTDNGIGCASPMPGNGLSGMASRMAEFDGGVSFNSAPGQGFYVEVHAPCPKETLAQ